MPRFFKSFKYAASGFLKAVNQERNMRFHICTAAYVYLFSAFYNFTAVQYAVITLAVCGVISLEIVNTAIERIADDPAPGKYYIAGIIKDMAAAAVLVYSIGAAVIGVIFYWDVEVFKNIYSFFAANLLLLLALVLSLVLSGVFVFKNK